MSINTMNRRLQVRAAVHQMSQISFFYRSYCPTPFLPFKENTFGQYFVMNNEQCFFQNTAVWPYFLIFLWLLCSQWSHLFVATIFHHELATWHRVFKSTSFKRLFHTHQTSIGLNNYNTMHYPAIIAKLCCFPKIKNV